MRLPRVARGLARSGDWIGQSIGRVAVDMAPLRLNAWHTRSMAVPERWRAALRRRELASDDRAGRYARGQVRRRCLATLRRAWKALAVVLVLVPVGFMPLAWTQGGRGAWFVMGLGVATAVWLAVFIVMFMSGAMGALDGLVAEQWTAAELRRLQRRGWRLVNGVVLKDGSDIDHVAVGPGGVLVVETKHSVDPWPVGVAGDTFMVDRLERACRQVRENARLVRLFSVVRRAVDPASVLAVLVVHSSSVAPTLGPPWDADGDVAIVHGSRFREWLETLDGQVLAPQAVNEAWSALADHARRRDEWEADHAGPISLTGGQMVRRVVFGVPLGGFAGAYFTVAAAVWLGAWGLVLAVVAFGAFGLWMRRFPALRWAANAWALGSRLCARDGRDPPVALRRLTGTGVAPGWPGSPPPSPQEAAVSSLCSITHHAARRVWGVSRRG